jgi:hypothetical protein
MILLFCSFETNKYKLQALETKVLRKIPIPKMDEE